MYPPVRGPATCPAQDLPKKTACLHGSRMDIHAEYFPQVNGALGNIRAAAEGEHNFCGIHF